MTNTHSNVSSKHSSAVQTAYADINNFVQLPTDIDLDKWQELGFCWTGHVLPTDFSRLKEQLATLSQNPAIKLDITLDQTKQLLRLTMGFTGAVKVVCQRCLEPLTVSVTHQTVLFLLEDDTQQHLLQETDEFLFIDEVLSQTPANKRAERWLPLAKLVEDELLLAVPLSSKHAACDMAITQVGEIEENEPDNPFAALATLKGKLSTK